MLNFNDPLRLTCIWKVEDKEYGGEIACKWEDLKLVEEYPYPNETWPKFSGEKYYIQLENAPEQSRIILGSYQSMVSNWTDFRRNYPLFIDK